MFDNIEKEILRGQDKNKIRKYLQLHKNDLTNEQYKYLSEFANSMTDRDKLQDIRDAKRNAFTWDLEKWKQENRQKDRDNKSVPNAFKNEEKKIDYPISKEDIEYQLKMQELAKQRKELNAKIKKMDRKAGTNSYPIMKRLARALFPKF